MLSGEKRIKIWIYSVLPPPPRQLSELIFFTPPGARAIFLQCNMLYNNK